jgi:YgiT-type zinc finger domain-containing protein
MTIDTTRASCAMCGGGRRERGTTTITLTRGEAVVVFQHVPADVCDTCEEAYIDSATAQELEQLAEQAIANGVRYEVRAYAVA